LFKNLEQWVHIDLEFIKYSKSNNNKYAHQKKWQFKGLSG
jgi:hypothetical protein